jgi:hypothetical protein
VGAAGQKKQCQTLCILHLQRVVLEPQEIVSLMSLGSRTGPQLWFRSMCGALAHVDQKITIGKLAVEPIH